MTKRKIFGRKGFWKAIVAIVITLAFITPVAVVANDEGSTNNSEIIPEIDSADLCPSFRYDAENTDVVIDNSNLGVLGDRFYGYNGFDPSGVLLEGPVYFDSENPGSITLLKQTISSFIAGGTWAGDTWYGCHYSHGWLWTIDKDGTMTLIGGGGTSLNGLSYDPTTDRMYGASSYDLYTVNMSDGKQTLVGPFNTGGLMIGIAFDGEGTLYGEDLGTDCLYSINPLTGAATLIGPLGIDINFAQDMSYDIIRDVLYLAAYWLDGDKYKSQLRTCNTTTGETTLVGNFQGGADLTCLAIPYIITHPPETPERPDGPSEGLVGVEYMFSTSTTDPEGEQVYYMWDWDDGIVSDWIGPYDSGANAQANHSWVEEGDHNITVKAKDISDMESGWSEPKTIHIINVPILKIGNITGGIGKIGVVIKNTGSVDAIGVDWNFTLNGGLIIIGKQKTGRIEHLLAHSEISVSSDLIIGFSTTVVNVCAEIPESLATKEQNAFVFLFFIKIIDA